MDSSAGSCQPSRDGGQVIPYDRATFGRSLPQDMTVPRLDRVTCPPPQERIIGGGLEAIRHSLNLVSTADRRDRE